MTTLSDSAPQAKAIVNNTTSHTFHKNTGKNQRLSQASARLVNVHALQQVAVSTSAALEILDFPEYIEIPGGAPYSYGIFEWQGNWVPLIDLYALVHGQSTTDIASDKTDAIYILVMAYKHQGNVRYIAIASVDIPKTINVNNTNACALPTDSTIWQQIARASIAHNNDVVPIISPQLLAECDLL